MKPVKKQTILQKTVILFVIFSLTLSSSFFALPKKAEAQLAVHDVINYVINKLNEISSASTAYSTAGLYTKFYVLDPLANMIVKVILRQMTGNIVQWINTGFQGKPSFLTNPNAFFQNIAKEQTNIFIIGLVKDQTNNPYALDIAYSILVPSKRGFSLYDDMARNCQMRGGGNTCPPNLSSPYVREAYARQFIYGNVWGPGGWNNWYSLTQYSQNNVYGAYLNAQNELAQRKAQATGYAQQDLLQSGGFLSAKKCVEWTNEGIGDAICTTYETQTPGKAAAELLTTSLTSPMRQSELSKDFWDSVSAITEAFVNKVLSMGVKSLSDTVAGAVSGGSGNNQSFINQYINYLPPATSGPQDPKTLALKDVSTSITDETNYRDAKNKVLGVVVNAENKVSEIQACYARIIAFNSYYKMDSRVISGQNSASSTLKNTIYPKKDPLARDIASSTILIYQLNEIKQSLNSTTNPTALLTVYQSFITLKGSVDQNGVAQNKTFHSATDVVRTNLIELPDMQTFFAPIILDEITPQLETCLRTEQEIINPYSSGI